MLITFESLLKNFDKGVIMATKKNICKCSNCSNTFEYSKESVKMIIKRFFEPIHNETYYCVICPRCSSEQKISKEENDKL